MSRSHRKTPVFGHTGCPSEKQDKQLSSRKMRRKVRQYIIIDPDNFLNPKKQEILNKWEMGKDGKSYWNINSYYNGSESEMERKKKSLTKHMRK